ncbi:MAG TPA: DinB family protein [Trebonia sp.]|jgi:hypothetical protein|nr:DinB family protein [Trebonia sp.]
MTVAELLADSFERVNESVAGVVDGLDAALLAERLDEESNPISWLVWHLSRVQDDHVAAAFGVPQAWSAASWASRLGLPEHTRDMGYGHTPGQVAATAGAICAMPRPGKLLAEYHQAVHAQTLSLVARLSDADLDRVVDQHWTPPVTLGVRLVSVVDDDARHVGQAEYVRGILLRRAGR